MIEILECPSGRLLDCLLTLSAHAYSTFADALTEPSFFSNYLIKMAKNELRLMQGQKSVHVFNASLVSLGLKLAATEIEEAQEVALEITKFIFTKVEHPQIVCAELLALLPKQAI